MAFWSDTSLDPKRQFKFKITFNFLSTTIGTPASYLAQTADRPTFTIGDGTKVDFLDKAYHFPGKVTWNPVKIKFVDSAGTGNTNTSKAVYDYLGSSGWVVPTTAPNGLATGATWKTVNKADAVRNAKASGGAVAIEVLDSQGFVTDRWELKNAWITTVALNNLDYAAEGILTAEFTFRYDWAEFK